MLYDVNLPTRLLLGTARYPSPEVLEKTITQANPDLITVCLRREAATDSRFRELLTRTDHPVLPNTAGCYTVKEAITTAHMSRELFGTPRIKLEVIGHAETLQPDPFGLVEAARILCEEGFQVFPYTTEDLVLGERLLEVGCELLMPWGAPIGSGQGLRNVEGLKTMRQWFKDIPLVIDAGIGTPSQAAKAMEMGFDAILLNSAVAGAGDPVRMAKAFRSAIHAGREGFEAGLISHKPTASASTPDQGLAAL